MSKRINKNVLEVLNSNYRWSTKIICSNSFIFKIYATFVKRMKQPKGAEFWKSREEERNRGIKDYIELAPTSYPLIKEIKNRAAEAKDMKILIWDVIAEGI